MNTLPCDILYIIFKFDGKADENYKKCVSEIKKIVKQWDITLRILNSVINLPLKTQLWLQKCYEFDYFTLDYIRRNKVGKSLT